MFTVNFGHMTTSTFFYTKVMSSMFTSNSFTSKDQHKNVFEFRRLYDIDQVWIVSKSKIINN